MSGKKGVPKRDGSGKGVRANMNRGGCNSPRPTGNGRPWKTLLLGLVGTVVIWVLSNATPIFFDLFLEGKVSKTTMVSFTMGLYGVVSGGLITILGEKIGYLGKEDYKKGKETRAEVDGLGTDMLIQSEEARIRDEIVEAKKEGKNTDELREKYETLQEAKELEEKQEKIEALEKEIEALQSESEGDAVNGGSRTTSQEE